MKALALLASDLPPPDTGPPLAFHKLMLQRESTLRTLDAYEHVLGFKKLFDIKFALGNFEDPTPLFPLRPLRAQKPYWLPHFKPYVPPYATDGSIPIGFFPTAKHGARFVSIPLRPLHHRFSSDRFLRGPIEAFYSIISSSEDADPDFVVPQKKKVARKFVDPDDLSDTASDTASPSGDYSGVQTEQRSTKTPKKKHAQAQPAKKNKKCVPHAYIDYDDPTLPTDEDRAAQAQADWHVRYLRGDTLYAEKSLTETLTSNLYFDASSFDPRPHEPASTPSISYAPQDQPVQVPQEADRDHNSLYFSSSSFSTSTSDSIYFNEADIRHSIGSNDDTASLVSSTSDSIFFDEIALSQHSVSYAVDSQYLTHDATTMFVDDYVDYGHEQAFDELSARPFPFFDTSLIPTSAEWDVYEALAKNAEEAALKKSVQAPKTDSSDFLPSAFGTPSLNVCFVE